jgi:hypothetical protein
MALFGARSIYPWFCSKRENPNPGKKIGRRKPRATDLGTIEINLYSFNVIVNSKLIGRWNEAIRPGTET